MTLADIANKPLSDQDVAAINSRLGELAQQNSPGQDPATNAALSNLSSDDESQRTQNETLAATTRKWLPILRHKVSKLAAKLPTYGNGRASLLRWT